MQTFFSIGLEATVKRFGEVRAILEHAQEQSDSELYNTLCRSAHVLLVAHFEGAIKDIISNIITDINKYGQFLTTPNQIKKTFCEYLIPKKDNDSKTNEKHIQRLMDILNDLETKLLKEAFLFKDNKNPSAKTINTFAYRFGIRNFLKFIDKSDLDFVFESEINDILELKNRIFNILSDDSNQYPYSINLESFSFSTSNMLSNTKTKTLWEDFIEELLKHRNSIAHGTEMGNIFSHTELLKTISKVEVLVFAFAMIIASYSNPISVEENHEEVV